MKTTTSYHIKFNFNYLFITFLSILYTQSYAQGPNFGNIHIGPGGEMAIHNVTHNFQVGTGGELGIVGCERSGSQGFLSFVGTANHLGTINNAHVDGYVKTYSTTPFIFPIGDNNKYRPAAISRATINTPASAAYYNVSPNSATTTSLKGGIEPVLPIDGPFSTTATGSGIQSVDNVEYWEINGQTSAKITLTWDIISDINTITANNLTLLTILGWDGSKWIEIPSTFDSTSLLGGSSTISSGSITTDINIVPDLYSVYTLGSLSSSSPDLTISLGQPLPSPIVAQTSFIPVTVANIGSGSSTGLVTVVIQIPSGTLFGTFPVNNNGWTCSTSGITATCTSADTIVNGANIIFNVPFIPSASQVGISLTILSAVVSGGGEPMANSGNNTSNTLTTPNVTSSNLTPNFTFSNTVFTVATSKTVIININEVGNIPTNGTAIEVFIPYSIGFNYAFNSIQTNVTVVSQEIVNNPNWTLTVKPAGLLLSSYTIIPSNGRSRIAITVTANTAGTVANIIANITPNGGGETNRFNNSATLAQSIQK